MKLAENLRTHRRRLNLSQEELAEKCRVSRQAIAKWENGDSVPTIEKLIFLADLFRMTLDELVGRKEDIALLEAFIQRYVPGSLRFGENEDVLPVVVRFLNFLREHNFSPEDVFKGFREVFLEPEEPSRS